MAHIHTNPGDHDSTVSAFIFRTDKKSPELLLHMHKKLGKLLQPGGHVELHETPWQAICHEITEETGYQLRQLAILQPSVRIKKLDGAVLHPQPVVVNTHNFDPSGVHKHTDTSYVFIADAEPTGLPEPGESTSFRWVDFEQINQLGENEILSNVRQIGVFIFTEVIGVWEPVDLAEFDS